jgi:hypothetical protein
LLGKGEIRIKKGEKSEERERQKERKAIHVRPPAKNSSGTA